MYNLENLVIKVVMSLIPNDTLKFHINEALLHYQDERSTKVRQEARRVTIEEIRAKTDHTSLKPHATYQDIKILCAEAMANHFFAVCVASSFVRMAKRSLIGSDVKIVSVVGFPHGNASTLSKIAEAKTAIRHGADEIDTVLHIGALKSKDYYYVYSDLAKLALAIHPIPLKIILETGALTREEKIVACTIATLTKATFIKTSTGFSEGGATVADVALMKKIAGNHLKIKASGGIRTYRQAVDMISAGADRLGTSASVAIVGQEKGKKHEDIRNQHY